MLRKNPNFTKACFTNIQSWIKLFLILRAFAVFFVFLNFGIKKRKQTKIHLSCDVTSWFTEVTTLL